MRVHLWKNERGLTLTELLAAVVLLGLIVVPLTNIGTTALRWHREDVQRNQALDLAGSKFVEVKAHVMRAGRTLPEPLVQGTFPDTGLNWQVVTDGEHSRQLPVQVLEGQPIPELIRVEMVVTDARLQEITRLETVVRTRELR